MDKDKYNYELNKEFYYHELDLKEKITNRINFSFGILTIIIGAVSFCYKKYLVYIDTEFRLYILIHFLLLLATTGISIYYIVRAYYNYTYQYIPSANEIYGKLHIFQDYYNDNKEYFFNVGKSEYIVISEAISININKIFREAATTNRTENLRKSNYLRKFSWFVLITIIILIINIGIIMYVDTIVDQNDEIHIIVKFMMGGENIMGQEDIHDELPTPPPTPPTPINGQIINENFGLNNKSDK